MRMSSSLDVERKAEAKADEDPSQRVVRCVRLRDEYVLRVMELIVRWKDDRNDDDDNDRVMIDHNVKGVSRTRGLDAQESRRYRRAEIQGRLSTLLDILRLSTLEVVEAVDAWRRELSNRSNEVSNGTKDDVVGHAATSKDHEKERDTVTSTTTVSSFPFGTSFVPSFVCTLVV